MSNKRIIFQCPIQDQSCWDICLVYCFNEQFKSGFPRSSRFQDDYSHIHFWKKKTKSFPVPRPKVADYSIFSIQPLKQCCQQRNVKFN